MSTIAWELRGAQRKARTSGSRIRFRGMRSHAKAPIGAASGVCSAGGSGPQVHGPSPDRSALWRGGEGLAGGPCGPGGELLQQPRRAGTALGRGPRQGAGGHRVCTSLRRRSRQLDYMCTSDSPRLSRRTPVSGAVMPRCRASWPGCPLPAGCCALMGRCWGPPGLQGCPSASGASGALLAHPGAKAGHPGPRQPLVMAVRAISGPPWA